MRTIKFRAWDKKEKKMKPVIQMTFDVDGTIIEVKHSEDILVYDSIDWNKIEDVELLEFTGLKDEKGVEIYEGDVLKFVDEEDWVVVVQELDPKKGFQMSFKHTSTSDWIPTSVDTKEMEIIGNIYQDKELINERISKR